MRPDRAGLLRRSSNGIKAARRGMAGVDRAGSAAAALLWEAAADAMAWTAAIHDHAAWVEARKAWAARAESDDAMKRAAEAGRRVADARGTVDVASLRQVGDAMGRAADLQARASKAFARSSRLGRAVWVEQRRASRAYRRAGDAAYSATVSERAAQSRKHARNTSRLAASALDGSESLARDAGRLAAAASECASPEIAWPGGRTELSLIQADMWENARQARAESAAVLRKMDAMGPAMVRLRRITASAAELSATKATEAARGQDGPDVQRAAAAWRKAASRAHKAEERRPMPPGERKGDP